MRILNCHLLDEIMFLYISYSITVFLRNYDVALTLTSLQSSRYLIGGSVLYYPQLSSISSYQLYVEVSMQAIHRALNAMHLFCVFMTFSPSR